MTYPECIEECNKLSIIILNSTYKYNNNNFIIKHVFPLPTDNVAKLSLINLYILNGKVEHNRFINTDVEVGILLTKEGKFEITYY